MSSDFTILIQGPLNEVSLSNVENYKKFGNVVISHWEQDDEELKEIAKETGATIVENWMPARSGKVGVDKESTFYWAVKSTHEGLKLCKSKYTIKTRSDEKFENLQPLIDLFLSDDSKFVCGNIFVLKISRDAEQQKPLHLGDHIFVSKTQELLSAYTSMTDMYDGKKDLMGWADQTTWSAEQVLGLSILIERVADRNIDFSNLGGPDGWRELFTQNFEVIDIRDLKDYVVQWQHGNRIWDSSKGDEFVNQHGVIRTEDV
tara:strand:+ start:2042 stop:2821 length:780 start_codon:yes stop_codon:yes gene_type:complete